MVSIGAIAVQGTPDTSVCLGCCAFLAAVTPRHCIDTHVGSIAARVVPGRWHSRSAGQSCCRRAHMYGHSSHTALPETDVRKYHTQGGLEVVCEVIWNCRYRCQAPPTGMKPVAQCAFTAPPRGRRNRHLPSCFAGKVHGEDVPEWLQRVRSIDSDRDVQLHHAMEHARAGFNNLQRNSFASSQGGSPTPPSLHSAGAHAACQSPRHCELPIELVSPAIQLCYFH